MPARVLLALATAMATLAVTPAQATPTDVERIGTSVAGDAIVAERLGSDGADTVVVVIGQMHGDEAAGRRVVDALRQTGVGDDTTTWLVPTMNPDGHRRHRRVNARGVDLNRNFPVNWRRTAASGSIAASEPETQAIMRWLSAVRPDAVLVLHQPFDVVDMTHRRARPAGRALARWMGAPTRVVGCDGPCAGTLTEWVDRTLGAVALTVELDEDPTAREIERTAGAIARLGRWLSDRAGVAP